MRGLLLTGGGARGAYQAGVLMGVARVLGDAPRPFPFPILTGMSAGSINTLILAGRAPDFSAGTKQLCGLWGSLSMDQVFRTDLYRLVQIATGSFTNLALGGLLGTRRYNAILDPAPLRGTLEKHIDFPAMRRALQGASLRGVAVVASHYRSGASVSFIEAADAHVDWTRARRIGVRAELTLDHVLASSAIPMVFPAVSVGGTYYGDGSVRMSSPFSPAIHLGAERILAVSVRQVKAPEWYSSAITEPGKTPTMAGIAGNMLNALFMDALDGDLERLSRINATLARIPVVTGEDAAPLRPVRALMISPSEDLGKMARPHFANFPARIRFLLRGLGAEKAENPDFLSYILFDSRYCRELIELGIQDAVKETEKLGQFFEESMKDEV
jgi:NTE family protein